MQTGAMIVEEGRTPLIGLKIVHSETELRAGAFGEESLLNIVNLQYV